VDCACPAGFDICFDNTASLKRAIKVLGTAALNETMRD
jgi:hypothetical protein